MLTGAKTSDRVLSVPAGETSHLIERFRVHAYPTKYGYKLGDVRYFTFRPSGEGGTMSTLYRIDYAFFAHPDDSALPSHAEPPDRERVTGYLAHRHAEEFFSDEKYRFLVLSQTQQEVLSHRPAVQPGARGVCYYTIGELRSGKPVVDVARR